jgi:hypothetical protein
MRNAVFWDVTPCGSCKNRSFAGTYRLHFNGESISELGTLAVTMLVTDNVVLRSLMLVTADVIPSSLILSTLMMEAIRSSQTVILTRATRHHMPEHGIRHLQKLFEIVRYLYEGQVLSTSSWKSVQQIYFSDTAGASLLYPLFPTPPLPSLKLFSYLLPFQSVLPLRLQRQMEFILGLDLTRVLDFRRATHLVCSGDGMLTVAVSIGPRVGGSFFFRSHRDLLYSILNLVLSIAFTCCEYVDFS